MGEITDALKRARLAARARQAIEEADASPELAPAGEAAGHEAGPAAGVGAPLTEMAPIDLSRELDAGWRARSVALESQGATVEAFRQLAIRVRTALERRGARSVAIAGPLQGEGKTTIACNLALALASLAPRRRSIALVDLDLRLGSVAADLGLGAGAGAGTEDVLAGRKTLDDVVVPVATPALDVYPTFEPSNAPHELLTSPRLAQLVRTLERRYAVVVYDTPPALVVSDARLILAEVATWVGVARAGSTRRNGFERMLELLPSEGLLGVTLNEGASSVGGGDYDAYYYGSSRKRSQP